MDAELLSLPSDLEDLAKEYFDKLLSDEMLFYTETSPEILVSNGFKFEFRICPALNGKRILEPDDPSRSKAGGPFDNPDPREVILDDLGPSHMLMHNKYCVYRPHLVVPTKEYVPQSTDLDIADFKAAWSLLKHSQQPQMMIFNCGAEAGASQGHKHMQVFARPDFKIFSMGDDMIARQDEVVTDIPNIPFKHFVLQIPEKSSLDDIFGRYQNVLDRMRHSTNLRTAYDVAMTSDWIVVIPRRHHGKDSINANAAGMLGLVWVKDQSERDGWTKLGYEKHLTYLGYPIS